MSIDIIGDHPLATNDKNVLKSHIGTFFVKTDTLVTLPGMPHALQHLAYHKHLNQQRSQQGLPPYTEAELMAFSEYAVDLIMKGRDILIRPDPNAMLLAFQADDRLQTLVPKQHIRFLHAHNAQVQQAIRERGEYWRISPQPRNKDAIINAIKAANISIGHLPLYYYNPETGTRYLTLQNFAALASVDDQTLRQQLIEIRDYSSKVNRLHHHEIDFFATASGSFGRQNFEGHFFETLSNDENRLLYAALLSCFEKAVPLPLRKDLPNDPEWRKCMFACLSEESNEIQSDAIVTGLSPEFFRQIYWHPGGRIEHDELLFDTIFEVAHEHPEDLELSRLCDERVQGFICNYVREFGSIQYVNIGGILPEMRQHPPTGGHRSYLAEVMYRGASKPVLRMLRIQRWGIRERLDENKDLLWAVMEAFEYTEYTLDRRLGCWELGMPLPGSINTRTIPETYYGKQQKYHGTRIWTTYYERDFINGIATDKIPESRFQNNPFALRIAQLLGQAAAPNLVVGRTDGKGNVTFDSGDEMILTDQNNNPERLVVADHAGTFNDVNSPLSTFVSGYARPVLTRLQIVPEPEAFINAYLDSLATRLYDIQAESNLKRHAYTALFKHSKQGSETFSDRWFKALERLEKTDVSVLIALIRAYIQSQRAPKIPSRNSIL